MIERLLDSEKFIPDYHVDSVFDLDYETLRKQGIKMLLIDIDNTLIPYDEFSANERIIHWIETLKTLGFFIVFVSNNHFRRIQFFAKPLNLSFVSSAKKPLKKGFKKALRFFEKPIDKDAVLVIGDQLITDVYGAKRTGLNVALVKPIKQKSEKWYTKCNRRLEQRMLEKIKEEHTERYQKLNLQDRVIK